MKIKTSLLIALIAACIVPSISQAGDDTAKFAKGFAKLDADKSGSLSKEEVAKNKGLTKRFNKVDSDKSGGISLEEFTKFNVERIAAKKKREAEKAASTTAE